MIHFDTNTANLIAAIAASLAAFASAISVIISAFALKRTTAQPEILASQFAIAERTRQDAARPRLGVEICGYRSPSEREIRGDVTFRIRNAGQVGFRVLKVRSQSGNTGNPDLVCSIEVNPGYPEQITANVHPANRSNPPILKVWFKTQTPDEKLHRFAAEWEQREGEFALLKSVPD